MSVSRSQSARAHQDADPAAVVLTYRTASLIGDYLRGAAGLGLTLVPLLTLAPTWPIRLGLSVLLVMFAVFLVQTWRRQRLIVRLSRYGLALVARTERQLAWSELDGLRLRWFGSRRYGSGWLELELSAGSRKLVLSSMLDQFDRVVTAAVAAARQNHVPLEPATHANVEALLGGAARGRAQGGQTSWR